MDHEGVERDSSRGAEYDGRGVDHVGTERRLAAGFWLRYVAEGPLAVGPLQEWAALELNTRDRPALPVGGTNRLADTGAPFRATGGAPRAATAEPIVGRENVDDRICPLTERGVFSAASEGLRGTDAGLDPGR